MKQKQPTDLRARRIKLGMTQEGLAMKVGMSAPMIHNIEFGAQRGSLVTRLKIARALKIDPRSLLTKTEIEDYLTGAREIQDKGSAR